MSTENQTAREIFEQVVALESHREQDELMGRICVGPAERFRVRVEQLVTAYRQATTFLEDSPCPAPVENEIAVGHELNSSIGPYRLVKQIGEGGFGQVFVAEQDQPLRRKVAVKLIKPGMDSGEVIARFETERQALALMNHQNISRVIDAGTTPLGRPYFVMELAQGPPITEFCTQNNLSVRARIELFLTVCDAIKHAHQKGIIHRDIKPSNILIATHDDKPVTKIIDFGVAKALNQSADDGQGRTRLGQLIGTPLYMSPEQFGTNPSNVDTRTDIYSLGVVLYELLAGTTPFERTRFTNASSEQIRKIVCSEEPPRPSARAMPHRLTGAVKSSTDSPSYFRWARDRESDLDWIVLKALEKEPDRRYATVENFAADLRRFLCHEPIEARPPSTGYKLTKFVRRNRGPVVATALLCVALICGVVGTTIGLVLTERQRIRAVNAEVDAVKQRDRAVDLATAERAANESSQKRLGQLEKANQILGTIFADLDYREHEEDEKPLRELLGERLGAAVAQLDGEAIGEPLVVARMQQSLSNALLELGYGEQAAILMSKALPTFEQSFGVDHYESIRARNTLGRAYLHWGKMDRAIPILEESLGQCERALGTEHVDTIVCQRNLAAAYSTAGQLTLSIEQFELALDKAERLLGSTHFVTVGIVDSLATALNKTGKADRAAALCERTLDAIRRDLGGDHRLAINTANTLAASYRRLGKLDDALKTLQGNLDVIRSKLGPDNLRTMKVLNSLGAVYLKSSRPDLAVSQFHDALRICQARLPADDPSTLTCLNNLATAYLDSENFDKALGLYIRCLELIETKFGGNHPDTLTTKMNLASCYARLKDTDQAIHYLEQAAAGIETLRFEHEFARSIVTQLIDLQELRTQYDRAEAWRCKWIEVLKKKPGNNAIAIAIELSKLAWNQLRQEKWPEAELTSRESLAFFERFAPDSWQTCYVRTLLGEALLQSDKADQAEPHLLDGYAGMKARVSNMGENSQLLLSEAASRLVRLYERTGRTEKASEWRKTLNAEGSRQSSK